MAKTKMMNSLLFLLLIATSIKGYPQMPQNNALNCQKTVKVNNINYILADRKPLRGTPSDLRIRYKTKDVFYTYISKEMRMSLQVWHPSGYIETLRLNGLGQSTAIDNLHDTVYLATDNGVYKYNNSIEPYAALNEDVMYIAVDSTGETIFIATWPQNRVKKLTNNGTKMEDYPIIPNGRRIIIDSNDNIYFDANKIWYVLKKGDQVPITIRELPTEKPLSMDTVYSQVFAMDEDGNFFSVDPENAIAKHLGKFDVEGVNTIALDSNQDIYIGTSNELIKFKVSGANDCILKD